MAGAVLDHKQLGQIADAISKWEGRIAEELGLTPADIAEIKTKHRDELKLQTREALGKWKQRLGNDATSSNLVKVFERAGCEDYAAIVKNPTQGYSLTGGAKPGGRSSQEKCYGGDNRFGDKDHTMIYEKLKSHADEWRDIGRGLDFNTKEMDIIKNSPMLLLGAPNSFLERLLSQWLQWAPGDGRGSKGFATRESLIAGLLKVNLGVLAKEFGYSEATETSDSEEKTELEPETPEYGDDFAKGIKKSSEMTKEQELSLKEENFSNSDIVIIAAVNDNEVKAIRQFMEPLKPKGTLLKHPTLTSMILGKIGGCNAVLVRTKMGPKCKENIKEALEAFPNAKAVIAVGVAYGASRNYKFGDVLVSEEILGCGTERLSEDVSLDARQLTLIHESPFQKKLLHALTFYKDHWDNVQCTKEGRRSNVHIGTIASMSLLLDNKNARDSLTHKVSKMIGGEMEGDGLLDLQKECLKKPRDIGVMIVKGISDFADGNKDKRWQLTAAIAAASYVDKMISENHRVFKPQEFAAEQ